ncbi:MAG TPA: SH3 domain-containing protein [Burkholderiales bacterium]|nr:SH3 domain-containing protein [Burkholderiales bacterium]
MKLASVRLLAVLGAVLAGAATAADFRSVGDAPAVGVDAPSARGKKTYIYGAGYPLEVIINLEGGWTKVRDATGDFAWIEDKAFGDRRTVLVKAPVADVRQAPDDGAPILFQVEKNVLMEWVGPSTAGWVQVRLGDGQSGYAKISQLWGA